MKQLMGLRETYWTRIVYEYGRLSVFQDGEIAEWAISAGGYTTTVSGCRPARSFPIANAILNEKHCLARGLAKCEESLIRIPGARLALLFQEQCEAVIVGGEEDSRYHNSLIIVVKAGKYGTYVDELWLTENPTQEIVDHAKNLIVDVSQLIGPCVDQKPFIQADSRVIGVLMPPIIAGQFIHEILGHLLEADSFSAISTKMMQREYPDLFCFRDDIAGFEKVVGLNRIDDEGVNIGPVVLFNKGRIVNTMNSMDCVGLGEVSNGFARSSSARCRPIPRMRMSIVDPVKESKFSAPNEYILASRACNGAVLPLEGKYVLKVSGYFMKNDRPLYYYPSLILSAGLFEAIQRIAFVGSDSQAYCSDCIKNGQILRVGYQSPSMYVEACDVRGDAYLVGRSM